MRNRPPYTDDSEHAARLVQRAALAEGLHAMSAKPVQHGNPYAEALFRTAKYRPEFPPHGFADLEAARAWASEFVHWYNHDHRHSGIHYVSLAKRHTGEDVDILAARHELYQKAREAAPRRWSGKTRTPIASVTLTPEREEVARAHEEKATTNQDVS